MVPDYSNIKFNMNDIQRFFKDQGVDVSAKDSKTLASIFKECDTQDEKGEKKADGVLTGEERSTFIDKIQAACPKLVNSVIDFFTTVEVVEEQKEWKKVEQMLEEQKAQESKNIDKET